MITHEKQLNLDSLQS